MGTTNRLSDIEFLEVCSKGAPVSAAGAEFLNKYKVYAANNPISYGLVNNFIREARAVSYDKGVNRVVEQVADYIAQNKIGWQLGSVCESILNSTSSLNKLNIIAAKKASTLLEFDEDTLVSKIKAGALRDVTFCEALRVVANNAFGADRDIIENKSKYRRTMPISYVEMIDENTAAFYVGGHVMSYNKDTQKLNTPERIDESLPISRMFLEMNRLLQDVRADRDEKGNVYLEKEVWGQGTFRVCEDGSLARIEDGKIMIEWNNSDEFREYTDLKVRGLSANARYGIARMFENLCTLADNISNVVLLDNASIYETLRGDRFVVITSEGADMAAMSCTGNTVGSWKVTGTAVDILERINKTTGLNLGDIYEDNIRRALDVIDTEHARAIKEQQEEDTVGNLRSKIAELSEKYKDNPIRMAVLARLGNMVSTL